MYSGVQSSYFWLIGTLGLSLMLVCVAIYIRCCIIPHRIHNANLVAIANQSNSRGQIEFAGVPVDYGITTCEVSTALPAEAITSNHKTVVPIPPTPVTVAALMPVLEVERRA